MSDPSTPVSTADAMADPLDRLVKWFRDPPSSCRTMPQWSWNEDISRSRISEVLSQFREQGCGGLFMHARPGIMVEYLSQRWFELWTYAMREAERLGLEWHIYDEFTAAGGNAGGYTTVESAHSTQREIHVLPVSDPGEIAGRRDISALYVVEIGRPGARRVSPEEPAEAFAVVERTAGFGHRSRGLAPVDLFHPDTTRAFIKTTHDKYAQYAGDAFGTTVRFVFNDEPHVNASRDAYPFSPFIAKEFFYDHGYALEENLGALCFWETNSPEVRYDYYRTLNRLYNQNFAKPLYDWCAAHDLEFTGHYMEHEWPSPASQPDAMASLRWMQAPGNDLLGFQFTFDGPQANGIYFLNLKELASVANQFGREHVMVESCGGAGYDAAFDVFKPTEDYLLAFGVNVMDPHLSHYSVVGARKYDFAQTLSDHSSFWPYYRPHADHVARVIAAMKGSEEINRTLVLHPTTTGWLYHQPVGYPFDQGPNKKTLAHLRSSQIALLLRLYGAQIDFDLGDEMILEEAGGIDSGRLRVGERLYETVVIPPAMETWTGRTSLLIGEFLKHGGVVYHLADNLDRVDGRLSDNPRRLRSSFPENWIVCSDEDELVQRIRRRTHPYIASPSGEPLPSGLVWRRSRLADGSTIYFFCNPWKQRLDVRIKLPEADLVELSTATGDSFAATEAPTAATPAAEGAAVSGETAAEDRASVDGAVVHLELEPRGHRLLLAPSRDLEMPARRHMEPAEQWSLEPAGAEATEENRLIIDFCDLRANGRELIDVNTVVADRTNWMWQGWNASPWLMAGGIKPFRSNVFRAASDPRSSFELSYRFTVDPGLGKEARRSLHLVVDRPEHYTVTVNGRTIPPGTFARWFDVAMGKAPIGDIIIEGENSVRIEARPFDTLCEAAPIYVIGAFALAPAERGFRIVDPVRLDLGDWTKQGMPFYPASVRYRFRIARPTSERGGAGRPTRHRADAANPAAAAVPVRLTLGEWAGALVSVSSNRNRFGEIYHPPYELDFEIGGEDEVLDLTVVGSMQNMMGPFYSDGVPVAPRWAAGPEHAPPGSTYRLKPSGLIAPPTLVALRER